MLILLGIIGMIGTILTAIADVVLMGTPTTGAESARRSHKVLRDISSKRLQIGHAAGIFVMPLSIAGFVQVALAIAPAGEWYAVIVCLTFAYGAIITIGFHATFAIMGSIMQLAPDNETLSEHAQRYMLILFPPILLAYLVGTLVYVLAILSGNSLYPTWMALFNPLLVVIVVANFRRILPAPLGGMIEGAGMALGFTVFFIISTLVLA